MDKPLYFLADSSSIINNPYSGVMMAEAMAAFKRLGFAPIYLQDRTCLSESAYTIHEALIQNPRLAAAFPPHPQSAHYLKFLKYIEEEAEVRFHSTPLTDHALAKTKQFVEERFFNWPVYQQWQAFCENQGENTSPLMLDLRASLSKSLAVIKEARNLYRNEEINKEVYLLLHGDTKRFQLPHWTEIRLQFDPEYFSPVFYANMMRSQSVQKILFDEKGESTAANHDHRAKTRDMGEQSLCYTISQNIKKHEPFFVISEDAGALKLFEEMRQNDYPSSINLSSLELAHVLKGVDAALRSAEQEGILPDILKLCHGLIDAAARRDRQEAHISLKERGDYTPQINFMSRILGEALGATHLLQR